MRSLWNIRREEFSGTGLLYSLKKPRSTVTKKWNALGANRTLTPCSTWPSTMLVYQFQHQGGNTTRRHIGYCPVQINLHSQCKPYNKNGASLQDIHNNRFNSVTHWLQYVRCLQKCYVKMLLSCRRHCWRCSFGNGRSY